MLNRQILQNTFFLEQGRPAHLDCPLQRGKSQPGGQAVRPQAGWADVAAAGMDVATSLPLAAVSGRGRGHPPSWAFALWGPSKH